MTHRNLLLTFFFAAAFGSVASASTSITTRVSIYAAAYNRPLGSPYFCGAINNTSDAQCSISNSGVLTEDPSTWGTTWYGVVNTASGAGHAYMDNNGLHAYAQMDVNGFPLDVISPANHYGSSFLVSGLAKVSFVDTLTLVGSMPIDITFNFHVDGSLYSFGGGFAWTDINVMGYDAHPRQAAAGAGLQLWGQNFAVTLHNVQPGTPIPYALDLNAYVQLADHVVNGVPKLSVDSAVNNFGNTLAFGNISFSDSNGNPAGGYSLTSESGFDFNQFVSNPTPEPSTFAAAGLGFALVLAWRRKRAC